MIPTFIRAYEASADIDPHLIVRFSDAAASQKVAVASANDQPLIGTSDQLGAATGKMADITRAGLASVVLGGTVEAGDPLTADANGKAVLAEAAAGETIRIVGYADQPGVANDIIDYFCAPGLLHEPAGG